LTALIAATWTLVGFVLSLEFYCNNRAGLQGDPAFRAGERIAESVL